MVGAKPFRYQDVDLLSHQLLGLPAKQAYRLGIDQHHLAAAIDDDHRVRRRLQQILEFLLGLPAVADVANGAGDEQSLFGLERAEADFHGEFLTALAQAVQFESRSHRARTRLPEEPRAMARVGVTEASGQQPLDRSSD